MSCHEQIASAELFEAEWVDFSSIHPHVVYIIGKLSGQRLLSSPNYFIALLCYDGIYNSAQIRFNTWIPRHNITMEVWNIVALLAELKSVLCLCRAWLFE